MSCPKGLTERHKVAIKVQTGQNDTDEQAPVDNRHHVRNNIKIYIIDKRHQVIDNIKIYIIDNIHTM